MNDGLINPAAPSATDDSINFLRSIIFSLSYFDQLLITRPCTRYISHPWR